MANRGRRENLEAYCPHRGGLKPSPWGEGFQHLFQESQTSKSCCSTRRSRIRWRVLATEMVYQYQSRDARRLTSKTTRRARPRFINTQDFQSVTRMPPPLGVWSIHFYLQNDGGWKVSSVRLLALTGIIEQAYLGLKAKPNLTEEVRELFENFKLTLAPDKLLKMWFYENGKSLDKLCALLRDKSNGTTFYINRDDKKFPEAAELLRRLNLSTA